MARTPLFRSVGRALSKAVENEQEQVAQLSGLPISRRAGIHMAAATSMAAYLNACKTTRGAESATLSDGPKGPKSDVVIVGGGAAGLSAAYYLKKAGVRSHVYEANDRLGGRIFTQYKFNDEGMFCERGGELIDTGHKEIQDLMRELGLELQKLPDPSRVPEVHYFGKKWRTEEELVKAFGPFAKKIAADAEGFTVNGEFTMPSYKDPLSDKIKLLDYMTLQAYLDAAKPICEAWVLDLIRVAYVGEYGLEADQQSAINLVSFIGTEIANGFKMFGESDELFRVKGGNSMLIKALADNLSGRYTMNHFLDSISRGSDGRFQLLFNHDGRVVEVKADTCILALPFTVLRTVKGIDKIGLSPRKLLAIRELGYGTNSKLMLGFKSRYWNEKGKKFPANDGNIVTDLPFQGGWDTSRQQSGKSGIFTNFMGGDHAKNFKKSDVQGTLANLREVYPGIENLHDKHVVLQVWPAVATARGSYICQKPGQYTTIGGCFGEPECNGTLLFAGEHTSEAAAGFMSGAVESGLKVATSYIEAQAPAEAEKIKSAG